MNIAMKTDDWNTFSRLNNKFRELAKTYENFEPYKIPEAHREVYKTNGGTPHLDQNYTVFGEVISGLEVVDSIAAEKTNDLDRPFKDIRILSARVIEEN
jgi:peptidyl-prolyl cis-trans isomerase B (cyclophilin B)